MSKRDRIIELLNQLKPLEEQKNRLGFRISAIRHEISTLKVEIEKEQAAQAKITKCRDAGGPRRPRDPSKTLNSLVKQLGKEELLELLKTI